MKNIISKVRGQGGHTAFAQVNSTFSNKPDSHFKYKHIKKLN